MAIPQVNRRKDPRYTDFNTSFTTHPVSGDLARLEDFEAVRRSVRNLILTDKYERLLDPRIGSNIKKSLFEPMDGATTMILQSDISECIKNYEPRAILDAVNVVPDFDRQTYYVDIRFRVTFSEQLGNVSLLLNRIR